MTRALTVALVASAVALALAAAWIWERPETAVDVNGLRDMREELEGVEKILWIGPHADDEVYVAGLLYCAHLEGKDCVIVAFQADEAREAVNKMSADLLGCRYVYASQYPRASPREKVRAIPLGESPDLVVTFHPETGFRMSKTHAAVGKLVTEIISAENLDIGLFYVLNNDPTLEELLGGADGARPTHYLDLNFLVSAKGGNLWEVWLADICLYSDLVPAAGAVCEDVNGVRTRMLRYEFYLEYNPSG